MKLSNYEWARGRYHIVCAEHHSSPESYIFDHCIEVFDKVPINDSKQNRTLLEAILKAHNQEAEWLCPVPKKKKR